MVGAAGLRYPSVRVLNLSRIDGYVGEESRVAEGRQGKRETASRHVWVRSISLGRLPSSLARPDYPVSWRSEFDALSLSSWIAIQFDFVWRTRGDKYSERDVRLTHHEKDKQPAALSKRSYPPPPAHKHKAKRFKAYVVPQATNTTREASKKPARTENVGVSSKRVSKA